MHSRSARPLRWGTVLVGIGFFTVIGCSSGPDRSTPAPLAPGAAAVSPAGVTTEVNAPATSTEEEYIQACLQARSWMDSQDGDRAGMVETYLGQLQQTGSADAATWNTAWAELAPGRQAALIVAVRAGADEACG